MEGRRGSGWLGLPAMIGLLAFAAVGSAVSGIGGLIAAVIAVLIVMLVIGLAMSLANKQ